MRKYIIGAIVIVKLSACTIVPMNPRHYNVTTYPDKNETCICTESGTEDLEGTD